jgi:hypothetical protein
MATAAFALSDEQRKEIIALLIDFIKERLELGRTTSYSELKGFLITRDETRRAKGKPELLPRGTVDLFHEGNGQLADCLREADVRMEATIGIKDATVIVWLLRANRPGDGYFADRHLDEYPPDARDIYAAQHVARVFAEWEHR